MGNKLKLLPLFFILLVPLGCSEEGMATMDVLKNRVTDRFQTLVGKGDIAIQKYENKIEQVKRNLIKVKVSQKTFEQKLEQKKATLANLENSQASPQKIELLKSTVQDMETFLQQIQVAETKLEQMLKTLIDNMDMVKLKVEALEAKRVMLDAMRTVDQYTNFEGQIDSLGGDMDNTLEEMQKEVYAIEAELEIETLLSEMKKM
jgi:phage shock protein A